ncbi:hypothetical protein VPH49_20195 [Pseudomonas luteola]|uniref:hypothetical protein n=1 Tax=Pseudomonas luteola TaxID=47886 RepID=UPI003A89039D
MSNDLESYLLPLERQLKLAALGCGYRIVDWVEERSVPLVEGKTDKPAPWQPHLDDGDSRQLQIAMEIHLTFGMCSECWPCCQDQLPSCRHTGQGAI